MERLHGETAIRKVQRSTETIKKAEEIKKKKNKSIKETKQSTPEKKRTLMPDRRQRV